MSDIHSDPQVRRAGAFDVRTFIALLIGLYGVVLLLMGLFATSDNDLAKAGGFNINLWTGIGLLVVAAAFQTWAVLRPVIVARNPDEPDEKAGSERAP
jgi:uncharacterized membrane protein